MANSFLSGQTFEFRSLVQDAQVDANLKNFTYLLNTIWWRNLRVGSWNFFLKALEKRSETVKYVVYTGTSGELTMPTKESCNKSETLKINGTFVVPEVIWAYLKPVKPNKHDEFIVFGYNTPFYSVDSESIACEDICNKINWLFEEDFGKIHLLPAFGVVHCCHPEDVAEQLDIFPRDKESQASAMTALPAWLTVHQNKMENA